MIRTLHRMLDGKTANNRAILVIDVKTSAELSSCQVLYVATRNQQEILHALAGLGGLHTLTIGESSRFLELGGAVNLVFLDDHMSFEVSLPVLDRIGVSISPTLLRYGQLRARPPV